MSYTKKGPSQSIGLYGDKTRGLCADLDWPWASLPCWMGLV
jgi:hypothetical protein